MMPLQIITPSYANQKHTVRKVYRDGQKSEKQWATWWKHVGRIDSDDKFLDRVLDTVLRTRGKNLPVALNTALPKSNSYDTEYQVYSTLKKFRKTKEHLDLENDYIQYMYLDFDKTITNYKQSGLLPPEHEYSDDRLHGRIDLAHSLLPDLCDIGLVGFFSSSEWFEDTDKPDRLNLHIVIKLDKPYPRSRVIDQIKYWNRNGEIVDEATMRPTQPIWIANPTFINTPQKEVKGDIAKLIEGNTLKLEEIEFNQAEIPSRSPGNASANTTNLKLTKGQKKREGQLLELARSGRLEGERNNLFWKWLLTENFYQDGDTEALKKILSNPIIRGDKNIEDIDQRAKDNIRLKLTGGSFGTGFDTVKKISLLDIAKIDISELLFENVVIAIKSGCGTNKTKGFIKKYMEAMGFKSALYVSRLKGTIKPFTKDIQIFEYYLEKGELLEDKKDWMRGQKFLATTDMSLAHLWEGKKAQPFDLVIIDESERVLLNSTDILSRQAELFSFCEHAKAVVLLDADATDKLTGYYAREIAEYGKKKSIAYINDRDWMENMDFHLLAEEADVIHIAERLIKQGKRVYMHVGFSDSTQKKRISALVEYFERKFPNKLIKGFDSNSVPEELRANSRKTIDNWIDQGLALLIHSPWSKIGWDYISKRHKFDATIGNYPTSLFSAPDILQACRRPRLTDEHYLYIGARRDHLPHNYFPKSLENTPGLIELKRDRLLKITEGASELNREQKANVPYHLKMLIEERRGRLHLNYTTGKGAGDEIKLLLTTYGFEKHEEEILRWWSDPGLRDYILSQYINVDEDGEVYEATEFKDQIELEDFKLLWVREKISIKPEQAKSIVMIMGMTAAERKLLDVDDGRHKANFIGNILDTTDEILKPYYPFPNRTLINFLQSDRDCFRFLITADDYKDLKKMIKRDYDRYENKLPWMVGKHKQSPIKFIKDFCEWLDIEVDERVYTGLAKYPRHNVIKEYKHAGKLIGKHNQKEQLPIIRSAIDQKLKRGLPLTVAEDDYQLTRGRNIFLTKKIFQHKTLVNYFDEFGNSLSF